MFCPVCKAEYRIGFAKCSDCGVDLVEHLPDGSSAHMEPAGDPDAMEVIWAGRDSNIHRIVQEALDKAQVAYEDDAVESGLVPAFQQSIHRLRTRRGDHDAVQKVFQELQESDALGGDTPTNQLQEDAVLVNPFGFGRRVSNRVPDEESTPGNKSDEDFKSAEDDTVDDVGEDFFPEDATSDVWSGEDQEMAENIRMCLREVGIGCDVRQENGKSRVLVLPQAEARAREIIREVIEGTPPE